MNASDNLFHNCELPSNRSTEPLAPRIEPATGLPLGGLAVNARSPADGVGIAVFLSQRLRPSRLAHATRSPGLWLWDGYLGAGKITLLTSQWKCGKTTLLSILLARLGQGGQLAGLTVAPGRAAVLSEESSDDWNARCKKLQIGEHVSFFCRPFPAKPTLAEWQTMIAAMLKLKREEGLDLLVIDPLAVFLPGNNENTAQAMLDCLIPLRDLTSRGLAVLVLHHPSKGVQLAGQAARGSGALAGYVDILIEKSWFGKADEADRRRWLRAYSRHEETRRNLILELVAAGNDYLACDPPPDPTLAESWEVLRVVLEDASERLTQQQILEWWPEDFRKPNVATISRGLARGVEQGLICRTGTGRRNDLYRYWLPGQEAQLHPGPGATKEELERWQQYWETKNLQSLLDFVSASPAGSPAAARVSADPQPEAVVEAPAVAAIQTAAEPCPIVVERSPDRSTTTGQWQGPATVPQLEEPCVSEPPSVSPCEEATVARSVALPVGGPAALVVATPEPVWPMPPSEPVSPSLVVPPLVLSPIAIPTKEEAERAAEVDRERRRLRRWPSG